MECQTQVKPQESLEVSNQSEKQDQAGRMAREVEGQKGKRNRYFKEYYKKNKLRIDVRSLNYYHKYKEINGVRLDTNKWNRNNILKLKLIGINLRCSNPKFKYYYGKGIKNLLSLDDMEFLWNRDKAWELKNPSIDRINSNHHYVICNCRFIENLDNLKLGRLSMSKNKKN
jgi:hypothetical protein